MGMGQSRMRTGGTDGLEKQKFDLVIQYWETLQNTGFLEEYFWLSIITCK